MASSLITDPWRNLRRSGAMAAWFLTALFALPAAMSIDRNWGSGGSPTQLWWSIGVSTSLAIASLVAWFTWRATDRGRQWLLNLLCWLLIVGTVASPHLLPAGAT